LAAVDELTALALAARDGDRVALAAFVRRAQPEVWRLVAHLAGRDLAEDLTQDVFVRALRALPAYRGDAAARTWLLSIARRAGADAIRGLERRRRLLARLRPAPEVPDPADPTAVEQLLVVLDPDRRAAFVLTQLLGLSYAEAAAACGCEVGTIRSRVARARQQLIRMLDADAAEG
jgi:RNA polymerase sigma-70 factor (ECF subfamily)